MGLQNTNIFYTHNIYILENVIFLEILTLNWCSLGLGSYVLRHIPLVHFSRKDLISLMRKGKKQELENC